MLLSVPCMADGAVAQKIEQTVKRRMNIEGIKKVNEWLRAFGRFGPCKKIERKSAL